METDRSEEVQAAIRRRNLTTHFRRTACFLLWRPEWTTDKKMSAKKEQLIFFNWFRRRVSAEKGRVLHCLLFFQILHTNTK